MTPLRRARLSAGGAGLLLALAACGTSSGSDDEGAKADGGFKNISGSDGMPLPISAAWAR